MPLPIADVLEILSDNLEKRKGALPLSRRRSVSWSRGLGLPFGGERVLYTGQMYQLMPAIKVLSNRMAEMENSALSRFFGLGRNINKVVNISAVLGWLDAGEQTTYDDILRNIVRLLRNSGIEFGCLYEKDLYSGALLYDEGAGEVFARHAGRVYRIFREAGVKRVITVDPHTTNMLRTVYPRVVPGWDLGVQSYLEVLSESGGHLDGRLDLDLAIHDSCIYARSENVMDQPRKLLAEAGVRLHEPELSGRTTHCCGGPLESLFPARAHQIAANRIAQLAACGNRVATMCPICLVNLKRAAPPEMEIRDFASWLSDLK